MTVELPDEPKSRKEQYLADIAGQDVTIPAEPKSREEQYLAYIAENGGGGGGGGSYTAGTGIDITDNTISVDTNVIQPKLTLAQTPGNSQTDVMSQNAATSMVFADPSTQKQVKIGYGATVGSNRNTAVGEGATAVGTNSVAVGSRSWTNANYTTAVGDGATVSSIYSTAIGRQATTQSNTNSVAIGYYASTSRNGEVNIGTQNGLGYNSTSYRVLGGVHDAVDNHDAVNLGQLNTRLTNLTILPISQSDYNNLQTKDPNTLYLITGA